MAKNSTKKTTPELHLLPLIRQGYPIVNIEGKLVMPDSRITVGVLHEGKVICGKTEGLYVVLSNKDHTVTTQVITLYPNDTARLSCNDKGDACIEIVYRTRGAIDGLIMHWLTPSIFEYKLNPANNFLLGDSDNAIHSDFDCIQPKL